jgi:hypothetical protein
MGDGRGVGGALGVGPARGARGGAAALLPQHPTRRSNPPPGAGGRAGAGAGATSRDASRLQAGRGPHRRAPPRGAARTRADQLRLTHASQLCGMRRLWRVVTPSGEGVVVRPGSDGPVQSRACVAREMRGPTSGNRPVRAPTTHCAWGTISSSARAPRADPRPHRLPAQAGQSQLPRDGAARAYPARSRRTQLARAGTHGAGVVERLHRRRVPARAPERARTRIGHDGHRRDATAFAGGGSGRH